MRFLPLTTGQLLTVFKPLAKLCIVAGREIFNEAVSHALVGCNFPTLSIFKVLHITHTNVFAKQELVARKILEYDADTISQGIFVPLIQIQSIEQDAALLRSIKSG